MHYSELDGVFFVEEHLPSARVIRHTARRLHGIFSQAQLKNLNDVKRELARDVNASSGNCLINFKYGQRSSLWTTLIGVDNVNWYGEGDIAVMPEAELQDLRQRRSSLSA